eukprot:RCo019523
MGEATSFTLTGLAEPAGLMRWRASNGQEAHGVPGSPLFLILATNFVICGVGFALWKALDCSIPLWKRKRRRPLVDDLSLEPTLEPMFDIPTSALSHPPVAC